MKLKKLFLIASIIFSLCIALGITVNAAEIVESGSCGDYPNYDSVTYTLYSDGLLVISGTGTIRTRAFYSNDSTKIIEIEVGITSIGNSAFSGCDSLTSISIPRSVTSIGNEAFSNCDSLTSITIPDSVTSIGNSAFSDCKSLTSVTIPESVTSIGIYAFSNCLSLTRVYASDIESWCSIQFLASSDPSSPFSSNPLCNGAYLYCNGALVKNLTIPDTITSIGNYTFYGCESLTSITIPESVTSIGKYAFFSCSYLTEVYAADSESWCNIQFSNKYSNPLCNNKANLYINNILVENLTLPNTVTNIKPYAFYNCTSLTGIAIPESVTSIGDYAFSNCTSLTGIAIPESVTSIGNYAFYFCTSLTSITIPESVTSIRDYVFYNCTSLTGIAIPESVTSIGNFAFCSCTSLTSITIPESVTSIGNYAFYSCTRLTSITIFKGVTSIDNSVFYNCSSLTDVYYHGTETDWENIYIGSGNDYLKNAIIHYLEAIEPMGITLDKNTIKIELGQTAKITATIAPADATSKSITWVSSDEGVATVSNGTVTANAEGTATITATTSNGLSAECVITVIEKQPKVTLFNIEKWGNFALIEICCEALPQNYTINVAGYDENGKFLQIMPIELEENNSLQTVMELNGETNFKVFLWDSFSSMKPLCDAVSDNI